MERSSSAPREFLAPAERCSTQWCIFFLIGLDRSGTQVVLRAPEVMILPLFETRLCAATADPGVNKDCRGPLVETVAAIGTGCLRRIQRVVRPRSRRGRLHPRRRETGLAGAPEGQPILRVVRMGFGIIDTVSQFGGREASYCVKLPARRTNQAQR
ncbi:hypothetical protein CIHG_01744 [Coccidioides immitis H538.4]|uniref:Uncharacterized protein n=1 Tax=Coccidioides immitis H538.4 TaxID=396776 RepID=A0A0J8RFH4_COCIT|nr:hypothetical protein CIHG_01744 [Coccidioides immitis H538.4]